MASGKSKRVYYHETFDVCEGLPTLLHRFPLRALIVARPGERVVLPDGHVPAELALLNRLGFGPREEDLVFVREDGSVLSGDNDLENAVVLPFSGTTQRARTFAAKHGATFHSPDREACLMANSKAVFQEIGNAARRFDLGVIAPRGVVMSRESAVRAANTLARELGKAVIKGAHSASGLQQAVVSHGDDPSLEGFPDEVVIQEWVPHVSSPSLQCVVMQNGDIDILSVTDQILDGIHHVGNRYPADILPSTFMEMGSISRIIGNALAGLGFWGVCGIDFLLDEDRNVVVANEVNARIPAPWYPWQATRRRYGEPLPFRMKSIRLRAGTSIEDVAYAAGNLLFDGNRREGFVPFCYVPEHSFVYGVTFSPDRNRMCALADRVDARLTELAP
jgi:hypothetical protein